MTIKAISPTEPVKEQPVLEKPFPKKELFKHNLICTSTIKTTPPFLGNKLDKLA